MGTKQKLLFPANISRHTNSLIISNNDGENVGNIQGIKCEIAKIVSIFKWATVVAGNSSELTKNNPQSEVPEQTAVSDMRA